MTDNKNQLREDAIEFAIQISDLCDEIKGCSVYVNQIVRSSSSMLIASHASCEAALRTLLRHTEALAEQSAPPSLQAFLADTAWLDYRKEQPMKKDKNPHAWKNELWNGIGELMLAFSSIAIGLGIALLFPHEKIEDVPAELFFLLGGIILFSVIGIVTLMFYIVKRKKETKDIRFIYNSLKDNYNLMLMTVTRNVNGEMLDILIIKGKSSEGKFELFKDGQAFNFSIEYFAKSGEEKHSNAYPYDVNDAISCIEKFMLGKSVCDEK